MQAATAGSTIKGKNIAREPNSNVRPPNPMLSIPALMSVGQGFLFVFYICLGVTVRRHLGDESDIVDHKGRDVDSTKIYFFFFLLDRGGNRTCDQTSIVSVDLDVYRRVRAARRARMRCWKASSRPWTTLYSAPGWGFSKKTSFGSAPGWSVWATTK